MKLFWRQQLHCSWHIAWAALGVSVGVAAARLTPWFAGWVWLLLAAALVFVAFRRRWRALIFLSLAAGLLLGLWRGSVEQAALRAYLPYIKRTVQVQGAVSQDTTLGQQGNQRFQLSHVRMNGAVLPGAVWVSTASKGEIKRSDVVTVRGVLSAGFGNVPVALFRAQLVAVAHPRPGDVALHVRDRFADAIRRAIPEPQASLGIGYLLGQHSSLPTDLEQQLRAVGLTHAVVASGYNLTILVAVGRRLLAGISKFLTVGASGLLIASFMLITGLSPSMARAGLVSGLSLAAWYYGRTIHPLVLLPFAAALTILLHPAYAWGDIGWELSFGAFAGVIVLAPLLQEYFWGADHPPGVVRQIVGDTLSAQLATMPIILAAFGQYSLYALPANVLVLPLVPLAMLATFVAGIAGLVAPGAAHWAGLPATLILRYSTGVVRWFANLPGAQGEIAFGAGAVLVSYALLVLAALYVQRVTKHRFRQSSSTETAKFA
jgi:competence protein ComEC